MPLDYLLLSLMQIPCQGFVLLQQSYTACHEHTEERLFPLLLFQHSVV